MALLYLVIVLNIIHSAVTQDCVIDHRTPQSAWETKLRTDIITNFIIAGNDVITESLIEKFEMDEFSTPPDSPTCVTVQFILKSFGFDNKEEIFNIHTWLIKKWNDPRLKWDPKSYDGINEVLFSSLGMWTPGLKHVNTAESNDLDFFYDDCNLSNNGDVSCASKETYSVTCQSKLDNWPFDTQRCVFEFGPWERPFNNVSFTFNSTKGVSMLGAEYGTHWNIMDYSYSEKFGDSVQLRFTFVVERLAEGLSIALIIPLIVCTHLTVASLLLDPGDVRLGISGLSLLSHFYSLSNLSSEIPKHSFNTPTILLLYKGSLVLTTLVFLLSFWLKKLYRTRRASSPWMSKVNDFVLTCRLRVFIWPRWESQCGNTEGDNECIYFGNIINSASFFIVSLTYIGLFIAYFPRV